MDAGLYKVCQYTAIEFGIGRKLSQKRIDQSVGSLLLFYKEMEDFMENKKTYLISDASRKVEVESHVLRYWEDELKLPVKRNELGHRYYTEEDITEFQEIKKLKEQGLQLKAIRMILKNGKLTRLPDVNGLTIQEFQPSEERNIIPAAQKKSLSEKEADEKAKRLEYLMKKLISEAVEESNEKFYEELSETLTKELDYQFRMQEEREEQREERRLIKEEEHYKQLDELIRGKSSRKKREENKGRVRKEKRKLFEKAKKV